MGEKGQEGLSHRKHAWSICITPSSGPEDLPIFTCDAGCSLIFPSPEHLMKLLDTASTLDS